MYTVRAKHCDHKASKQQISKILHDATSPLNNAWKVLEKAERILIKANLVWPPERIQKFAGRYRELVDPAVMEAVLRLLKERTGAELILTDTSLTGTESDVHFKKLLNKMDVKFLNASQKTVKWQDVPGGGLIFKRYLLNSITEEVDAAVSVAKLKSHKSTGITLCTKNLFGLYPLPPEGRPRRYLHHLVRLPYAMVDLGSIVNPCLNIIDGLVGQSGSEWDGEGRIADMLIAGDNHLATDICGAYLMGHDPAMDWPHPPFRRERSYLRCAVEKGLCPHDINSIDFVSEVKRNTDKFMSDEMESPRQVIECKKGACEQALIYYDQRDKFIARHAGQYIVFLDRKVIWAGKDPDLQFYRGALRPEDALYVKYVDPEETEGEQYEVYQQELDRIAGL